MKTPTLAQLKRLAKRKGFYLVEIFENTLEACSWESVDIQVRFFTGDEAIAKRSIAAALSALPDAEKAKGGA